MKISFLVTYYNQEKYVRQSMDSILSIDKPSDWEILVGDDGSSDGTVNIVNEYIEKYPENIKLYIMPRDKNKQYYSVKRASENRINLFEHCTGDCFCTLDGDDFFCDGSFVKEAIDIFNEHKDVSIVSFGYRYYRDGRLEEEKILLTEAGQCVDTEYYIRNLYLPAGACVHKKPWDKERNDYIKQIGYFDDNDIIINSLNYGQMYCINRSIYAYRQEGTSTFNSMSELEQAVLNVQGMDVDLKLIDSRYIYDIYYRNSEPILIMYILKNKLKSMLGDRKYELYCNTSSIVKNSLCFSLLNYKKISSEEKKKIKRIVNGILFSKRRHIKTIAKCYLGVIK